MNDNKKDCSEYVERFFDSLMLCLNHQTNGDSVEKDNTGKSTAAYEIFDELKKKFSENEEADNIPWKNMWYDIITSETFEKMSESQSEESERVEKNANEPEVYGIVDELAEKLVRIDEQIDGGRFTWVLQAKYYGPDISKKDSSISENWKENFERSLKKN